MLCDLTGILLFLLLFAILSNISGGSLLGLFSIVSLRLFSWINSWRFREWCVLMLASVDFSGQTLDRLDVVKAESGHLLASLLHLLDAR